MKFIIPLLLLVAVWTILPFNSYPNLGRTSHKRNRPAGEISAGTRIVQQGVFGSNLARGRNHADLCIGVQMATYSRTNGGHVEFTWQQGKNRQSWIYKASDIKDNMFQYLCPRKGIETDTPYSLTLSSSDGRRGDSTTAWTTLDTQYGQATINGKRSDRSLSVELALHKKIGLARIATVDHGAFFLGFLISVFLAVFCLLVPEKDGEPNADATA
jgi:hypothetical protein